MSRPRIDTHWVERIRQLTQAGGGSTTITARLRAEARREGRDKPPSEKTIRTYMRLFRDLPPEKRRQYDLVYWPESFFDNPDLPWEAAEAVLEVMRARPHASRLTVRAAKWLWRLTLAAPSMPLTNRLDRAHYMAACEASEPTDTEKGETWRGIERQLLNPGTEPLSATMSMDAAAMEDIIPLGAVKILQESMERHIMDPERGPETFVLDRNGEPLAREKEIEE